MYFWLCWVVFAACRLSLVAESGLVLVQSLRFSNCDMQAQFPSAYGIFPYQARTRVPYISKQILNHRITTEVPEESLLMPISWQEIVL